jgi:hypothetical protein
MPCARAERERITIENVVTLQAIRELAKIHAFLRAD